MIYTADNIMFHCEKNCNMGIIFGDGFIGHRFHYGFNYRFWNSTRGQVIFVFNSIAHYEVSETGKKYVAEIRVT